VPLGSDLYIAPVYTIIGGEGIIGFVLDTFWLVSVTLFAICSLTSLTCPLSHPRVRGRHTHVAPPILFSSVASSWCPGALLL
jgi:hypothetical protein